MDAPEVIGRIARYHVEDKDWPGIAYHVFISYEGDAYLLNDLETTSYHCYAHNEHTIGLAFEGDFTRESATQQQIETGKKVVVWLGEQLGELKVIGHKNMLDNATACPGEFPVGTLTGQLAPSELETLLKRYNDLREAAIAARNTLDAALGGNNG